LRINGVNISEAIRRSLEEEVKKIEEKKVEESLKRLLEYS
jgi:hypothetical protein